MRALVGYNDWLSRETVSLLIEEWIYYKELFFLYYTYSLCKILYKVKLYYSTNGLESFNMNNFLVWVFLNFRLADKNIYVANCKKSQNLKPFYNKSIN